MTDKDRKVRDERVKLRAEVEKWKRNANEWKQASDRNFDACEDAKKKVVHVEARLNELRQAYDTLCASLGKGGNT